MTEEQPTTGPSRAERAAILRARLEALEARCAADRAERGRVLSPDDPIDAVLIALDATTDAVIATTRVALAGMEEAGDGA